MVREDLHVKTLGVADQAKIEKLEIDTELNPKADDSVDLGSSTKQFKDGYFDGKVYMDELENEGARIEKKVVSKSTTYTALVTDHIILLDSSGGAFTVTLPAVAGAEGQILVFKMVGTGTNAVTLDGSGAETIDGAATVADMDAQFDMLVLYCDGTEWHIIGRWIH